MENFKNHTCQNMDAMEMSSHVDSNMSCLVAFALMLKLLTFKVAEGLFYKSDFPLRGYVKRILLFQVSSVLKSLLSAFTHTQNSPVKL